MDVFFKYWYPLFYFRTKKFVNLVQRNMIAHYKLVLLLTIFSCQAFAQQTITDWIDNDTSDSRYTVHSNETITDNATGLMWARCPGNKHGNDCSLGSDIKYNWRDALIAASNSELANYNDWRLPNVEELRSIVAYGRYSPSINTQIFPTPNSFCEAGYWSSSAHVSERESWYINFIDGSAVTSQRTSLFCIRLVRN